MDSIFKKLNFKNQEQVIVVNPPESFRENMNGMIGLTTFVDNVATPDAIHFMIAFVTQQHEIDTLVPQMAKKLEGDAIAWYCYPKKSSKKYQCDFNRDTGWEAMGKFGLEPVRQVAIDKDWSALRFRKVAFIKKITRRASMALTEEAKKRTTGRK